MIQLGSLLMHFHPSSKPSESASGQPLKQTAALPDFLQHVIKVTGLRKEDVYNNLRIPDHRQTAKNDIDIVILSGQGIFCIDVKPWRGTLSDHNHHWHLQVKEKDQNFTNTHIEQVEDPLKAVTLKMANLCAHLKRNGVHVRQSLFFPKVIFLSSDCELDEDLRKRRELIVHQQIDDFLQSFKESYMTWISDALTPSWISGHLSYRQMETVREVLRKVGTWDLLRLHGGEQLKGDYQSCPFIALNRQDVDTLEFSRIRTLSAHSLWALLGHIPQEIYFDLLTCFHCWNYSAEVKDTSKQSTDASEEDWQLTDETCQIKVTIKMYKRGSQGWLGKSLNATATIPSNTCVTFRIHGEELDTKIQASSIESITLSV